jgi:hypothetical protein
MRSAQLVNHKEFYVTIGLRVMMCEFIRKNAQALQRAVGRD